MSAGQLELFEHDSRALREPGQVFGFGFDDEPAGVGERLESETAGDFWGLLEHLNVQLIITREYEHLVVSLRVVEGHPEVTYLPMPHPSGIALDPASGELVVAATRNPNQVYRLMRVGRAGGEHWLPRASAILPGSLYLHDLAFIDGALHANAVGRNCVIRFDQQRWLPVFWPRSVEIDGRPDGSRNHLQLNSIAAGVSLATSYFTASCEEPGEFPPGHEKFEVDRRGVVFAGRSREVVARGLTRPHSARLWDGNLYVDDSGYGRLVAVEHGGLDEVEALPGWTRGLAFSGQTAFVGTSRVLPRFEHYAPGVHRAVCGIHAVDIKSGRTVGRLLWPTGNQIFGIEVVPQERSAPLPYSWTQGKGSPESPADLFYAIDEVD